MGGGGNDEVVGGLGYDQLFGGAGDDLFVFATGDGTDRIADFEARTDGGDVIDLTGVGAISSFSDLQALAAQNGTDAVFDFGNGDQLTLFGVNTSDLQQDDFLL